MKAGELRGQIAIQRATGSIDAQGEEVITGWRTVATRWFSLETLSGAELWKAQQVDPEVTHLVKMRYYADLSPKNRLLLGSRAFGISYIDDQENRHIEQWVYVSEQVSLGNFFVLTESGDYILQEDLASKVLIDNP